MIIQDDKIYYYTPAIMFKEDVGVQLSCIGGMSLPYYVLCIL